MPVVPDRYVFLEAVLLRRGEPNMSGVIHLSRPRRYGQWAVAVTKKNAPNFSIEVIVLR